jgi:hypothetical protein
MFTFGLGNASRPGQKKNHYFLKLNAQNQVTLTIAFIRAVKKSTIQKP